MTQQIAEEIVQLRAELKNLATFDSNLGISWKNENFEDRFKSSISGRIAVLEEMRDRLLSEALTDRRPSQALLLFSSGGIQFLYIMQGKEERFLTAYKTMNKDILSVCSDYESTNPASRIDLNIS